MPKPGGCPVMQEVVDLHLMMVDLWNRNHMKNETVQHGTPIGMGRRGRVLKCGGRPNYPVCLIFMILYPAAKTKRKGGNTMYIYEAHYEDTKSSARVTRTIEINPYNGLDDDDLYFVEAAKRAVEIRKEYLGVDLMSLELIAK